MAGKRFILLYQLHSFLNPAFPKVASAFFILYFAPALLWAQEAKAKQSIAPLSETKNQSSQVGDWQLIDVQTFSFRTPSAKESAESNEGELLASGLVQEGRELYQAGHYLMAVQVWQQATHAYRSQRDALREALVLSNLSLAYQELGQLEQAGQAIAQSLKLVQNIEAKPENSHFIAQILNNQASLQLAGGQSEQALTTWQKAAALYDTAGDRSGMISSLLNSAQALQALGFYRRAVTTLDSVNKKLRSTPDSPLKAVALRSLGNALRGVGNLNRSQQVLEQGLVLARELGLHEEIDAALMSLGKIAQLRHDKKAAWEFYKLAAQSNTGFVATQAKLNQLSLLIENRAFDAAANLASQIVPEITSLPAKRSTIYAQINFAQSLKKLQTNTENIPSQIEIAQLLANSIQQAKSIEDPRAEAYALGCLGNLYEDTGQWSDAKKLTQQSLILAGTISAADINYRFSWQLGRILKAQGDIPGAIASLTQSTNALKSLRNDLVAVNPSVQFDFRDQVEPVYRQLAGLLLLSKQPSQENLIQARDAIETLQLAELNNFFRTACLEGQPIQIDRAIDKDDPEAAVIYPIILPDRLEVIVKLPGLPLQHYKAEVPQSKLEKLLEELRLNLSKPYALQNVHLLSKQIYDWLIKPVEASLAKNGVQTLVFVLDGSMRNIPMAALYDGQQYLVQKYAIAFSPGLQLLPPVPLGRVRLKALGVGLTEARQGFSALPDVGNELNQIKSKVSSVVLLNQKFTSSAFEKELIEGEFPIVHLATHGQFSSLAERTFVLAWDKPITINDLNDLLRAKDPQSYIELLVLSACQTAAGDNRAALGLAGIAIKAGARSTVASLWSLDDESSAQLMGKFYQALAEQKFSKAEALRMAQLALLKNPRYQNPAYWASYVLVGNWL